MLKEITKAQEIIDIISPIPADKFCKGKFENSEGQCCFIGHINQHISNKANADYDGFGARQLTRKFLWEKHSVRATGVEVNNYDDVNGYTEPVIKDRVMHMLTDMVEAGY